MTEINKDQKIAQLESEVMALKNALAERVKAAKEKSRVDLGKIKGAATECAGKMCEKVKPVIDKVDESTRFAVEKAGDKIAEKPVKSMAIAIVAGLVVGTVIDAAIRRRNK